MTVTTHTHAHTQLNTIETRSEVKCSTHPFPNEVEGRWFSCFAMLAVRFFWAGDFAAEDAGDIAFALAVTFAAAAAPLWRDSS